MNDIVYGNDLEVLNQQISDNELAEWNAQLIIEHENFVQETYKKKKIENQLEIAEINY